MLFAVLEVSTVSNASGTRETLNLDSAPDFVLVYYPQQSRTRTAMLEDAQALESHA
jgi:hypothetical protein